MIFRFGARCVLVVRCMGLYLAILIMHVNPTKIWKCFFYVHPFRPNMAPGRYWVGISAMVVVLLAVWAEKHSLSNRKQQRVVVWISVHEEQNFEFSFLFLCAADITRASYIRVIISADYKTNPHLKTHTWRSLFGLFEICVTGSWTWTKTETKKTLFRSKQLFAVFEARLYTPQYHAHGRCQPPLQLKLARLAVRVGILWPLL